MDLSLSPGSSPLTRGKLEDMCGVSLSQRLIPAHAGKTGPQQIADRGQQAHPRSRGENVLADTKKFRSGGSSPLTRGKPVDGAGHVWLHGLIPAHAGKTPTMARTFVSVAAHPRSRGENWPHRRGGATTGGSSPLTRGKRADRLRER